MISEVYAMGSRPEGQPGQPSPGISQLLFPMVVVFAIFYFLILRPQKKKEGQLRKFLDDLKKGDEVVTQAGIYGRVANIEEKIVTLEVANNVKIRIAKSAIAGLQAAGGS
ncbi:MAG TPA: preprotein translocase subunit YajC [Bdellovibrionota bacterium]|nr:preprotein translocase subunit YajC [Bdellovibrionota bacterium]